MTWQPTATIYPDVELLATTFLRPLLVARDATTFVSNAVPNPRRDRMVIVRRDGGTIRELRDRARLSVRCWSPTDQKATDLALLVSALLSSMPLTTGVLKVVHQSGPLSVPDDSGQALRLSVYEIHTRGTELTPL